MEAYKDVATFYATGPFYDAAAGTLISAAGKASDLLAEAAQARAAAQDARAVATNATEIADEARAAIQAGGKTEEEIATLQQKAQQMDKLAEEAESQAGALDDVAGKAESLAQFTSENVQVLTEDASNIPDPSQLALPQGGVADVTRNALNEAEYDLAQEFSELRGGHFEGQTVFNEEGIGGWIDGTPVSLKNLDITSTSPSTVRNNLWKARNAAYDAGYTNIEVVMDAPGITDNDLTAYACTDQGKTLLTIPGSSVVHSITVFCSDGIVYFPPAGGI